MVESKKALPKEPRLGYYNTYSPGPMAFGPFSPPGPPRYPASIYVQQISEDNKWQVIIAPFYQGHQLKGLDMASLCSEW